MPDDAGGAELAVVRLIRTGRRRIAHVTGPQDFEAVILRQAGYTKALTDAGIAVEPVLYGPRSEVWGRAAVGVRFADPLTAPDGIFAGNDQIARGVLERLHDRGIDVPRQVGVIGFDNRTVMAEPARPPLTSIDMNLVTRDGRSGRRSG